MKWPIKKNSFTPRQLAEIGSDVVSYLDGIGEDDEISGARLVERVMLAVRSAQDNSDARRKAWGKSAKRFNKGVF